MAEATNPITTASNPRVGKPPFAQWRDELFAAGRELQNPAAAKEAFQAGYAAALASAPPPEAGAGGDLVSYLHRQWAWSRETFGPALRTKGIVQHITKELREIEAEPHDLAEWVDVIILAMDGFWRHGGKPEDLLPAMQAKQDRNFARTWPDWRTMGEDQAIEHDRSGEAASCDRSPKGEDAEGGFVHEGAVAEGQTP